MLMHIFNDGQEIVETNYWGSEAERAGKLFVSCNAGAIRLLLPRSMGVGLGEMRVATYAICSVGPWPDVAKREAVELMFEDFSPNPYALHVGAESCDMIPADPGSKEWVLAVWVHGPRKTIEMPCKWRRSKRLPDLSAWDDSK